MKGDGPVDQCSFDINNKTKTKGRFLRGLSSICGATMLPMIMLFFGHEMSTTDR